jgi:hypothetical protein
MGDVMVTDGGSCASGGQFENSRARSTCEDSPLALRIRAVLGRLSAAMLPHREALVPIHAFRAGCAVRHYCCSGSAQTQIPRMFTTQLVLGLGLVSVGEGEGEGELVPGDDGAVGVGLAE